MDPSEASSGGGPLFTTTSWRTPWLWNGEYYRHLPQGLVPPRVSEGVRRSTALLATVSDDGGRLSAIGTGFAVTLTEDVGTRFTYFVTTNRVVQAAVGQGSLYIRVPLMDGTVSDLRTDARRDWIAHSDSKADIAVCPIAGLPEGAETAPLPADLIPGRSPGHPPVDIGQRLISAGLRNNPADESSTVPVVSFGSVYLPSQLVATAFLGPDSRPLEIDAYLTEWPAWAGSGGSPVFRYRLGATEAEPPALVGIVHSHINLEPEAEAKPGAVERGIIATDFGLAAVVPAERLGEILSAGELARIRQEAIDAKVVGQLMREREESMELLATVANATESEPDAA